MFYYINDETQSGHSVQVAHRVINQMNRFFFTCSCLICLNSCFLPSNEGNYCGSNCFPWKKEIARLDSILNTLSTDFEKTSMLREYCGELLDIGLIDQSANSYYNSLTLEDLDLEQFYHHFSNDGTAAQCGLTSLFYIKLVEKFGYNAHQYSFGFIEPPYSRFIHSFPLVEILDGEKKKLIVQDPYLGLSFRDSTGSPLDFFDFLSLLMNKEYGGFEFDTSTVSTYLLVPDTSLYWPYLNDSCKAEMLKNIKNENHGIKDKIPILRNYSTLLQAPCNHFENGFLEAMRANGYDEPFVFAYTLRVNTMIGSHQTKLIQDRIDYYLRSVKTIDQ